MHLILPPFPFSYPIRCESEMHLVPPPFPSHILSDVIVLHLTPSPFPSHIQTLAKNESDFAYKLIQNKQMASGLIFLISLISLEEWANYVVLSQYYFNFLENVLIFKAWF